MNDAITASFRLSSEELLTAHRLYMRHSRNGRKIRRCLWVIVPLSVAFGAATIFVQGLNPLAAFLIALGLAVWISPLFVRRLILKHFAKRPDRNMLVTWEIHGDHIATKTEASSSAFEWRMILEVLQAEEGFLIFLNDRVFHWLPAHAFQKPEDVEAFAQLAKAQVQRFESVIKT
jgi:hypothetical protein